MRLIRSVPGWLTASLWVSLGGFLNGYDTGAIGALSSMPAFTQTFGELSASQLGLVVSTVMLTGGVPAVFAGRLAERFGAARIIGTGGLIQLAGAALEASAGTLTQLVLGRAVAGLGQGVMLTNIVIYICEIAPAARRGMLVCLTQMLVTLGIVAGFFTCYGSIGLDSSWAWRLPFVVQCVVGLALAAGSLLVPPSPRWLLAHGRHAEAEAAIARLSIPAAEAEKDILQPFLAEQAAAPSPRAKPSFWSIFARPVRLRTCLGLFLLAMVQLSGIDGVLYYAPLLFRQAGLAAGTAAFLASGVSGIAIFAVSVPAFLLADRIGRRASLIGGGLGMAACMLCLGALYASGSVHAAYGSGRWAAVALIYVFALLYAATWAMSAKLYAGEIQPSHTRLAANSLAQGVNFFTNFLVAFTTPILLSSSSSAAYFLFGGFILLTVAVCALYMPETRGRSLEAIGRDGFAGPGPAAIKKLGERIRSFGLTFRGGSRRAVLPPAARPHTPPGAPEDVELQDVGALLKERQVDMAASASEAAELPSAAPLSEGSRPEPVSTGVELSSW